MTHLDKCLKNNSVHKDKQSNKIYFRRLWSYISPYKFYIFLIAVFAILESVTTVFGPKLTGNAITILSLGTINFDILFSIVIKLLLLSSMYAFSSCLSNYFVSLVTIKITYRLRNDISLKMNKLSFEYINSLSYGEVLSCVVNDVDNLSSAFTQSINCVISSFITAVGVLLMMITINVKMTFVFMVIIPVVGIISALVLKKTQKYFEQYRRSLGEINGFVEEIFSGHEIVSVFDVSNTFKTNFKKINEIMYDSSFKAQFLTAIAPCIMELISKLSYIVACIMGGYFAVLKLLSIGDITAFIAYSNQFMQPVIQFSSILGNIRQTFVSAKRIFEFLDAEEEFRDEKNLEYRNENYYCSPNIEFKNVVFGYDSKTSVINNFSLKVNSGQTVAIVGETGSGKTTIINILMRFFENFEGKILLNGVDIKKIPLDEYRKLFGLVTQDSWLCSGTIFENIAYGKNNPTESEVKFAAEFVGANHFIESLKASYNTVIEENMSNISHGQKQLLCIARMILKNAPIFILDEATSSVDVFTEDCIQNTLRKVLKEKTSFIIAHRLSTIKSADLIAVIDKGKLIEIGNHYELMSKKGVYFDMYISQFDRT